MVTKLIGPFGLVGPSRSRYDTNDDTDLGLAVELTVIPDWAEVRYPEDVGNDFGSQFYLPGLPTTLPTVSMGGDDIPQDIGFPLAESWKGLRAPEPVRWHYSVFILTRSDVENDMDVFVTCPTGFSLKYWLYEP